MAASSAGSPSPEFLAETNNPYLDQRVSIAFIVIDTAFLVLFYASRYYNPKAVVMTQVGGVGHHVAAVPVATFQTWLQLSKVLEFTYTPAVMFAKLAALFLYYQVFEVQPYRRIIIGIGVIIVAQDPTWYASGGPMIYALVEPSIYMIASILPTTRHLYRRIRKKARLTAHMRSAKTDSAPDNRSPARSADGDYGESRETTARDHTSHEDSWHAQRHSSQEELTLGQISAEGKLDTPAPDTRPREMVRKKIEVRDRGRPMV
ncbi:hypothetical protein SLS60_009079 [Paraconiothyrium brasiliense]|uniref:Rhodopsin domain-containing protein n=1 Tax=Paraconiothyrium brasiliense TaxID=300254 RepID=A0ABR3QWM1_9PLEO